MSFDLDRVYGLLPAIYRERDAEAGEPLKAVLTVIAAQMQVVGNDIDQLYNDLFIETCRDWIIPYIGDLIGHDAIYSIDANSPSTRAEVARTIGYRRRKGTLSVLEQMAHDVTNWPAHAVEYFELLATTQWLNHLRMERPVTPDLRRWQIPVFIDSPFDNTLRTLDIRHIDNGRGRYNIPNIGVHFWRLEAFKVTRGSAARIAATQYTFDPVGFDIPLFNPAQPLRSQQALTQTLNIPAPLDRRAVYEDLAAGRLYFAGDPIWRVFVNSIEIPLDNTRIALLHNWGAPPAPATGVNIAVDPELGRITFSTSLATTDKVEVLYSYGFSGPYGAGPYPRTYPATGARISVSPSDSLAAKLADVDAATPTAVEIDDSLTLPGDVTITLQSGQRLALRSASGTRPVIDGAVIITATPDSALTLDGLLISKGIRVNGKGPFTLTVARSTVGALAGLPPSVQWNVTADAAGAGQIVIDHSVLSGAIYSGAADQVSIAHSLISPVKPDGLVLAASDAGDSAGVAEIICSTLLGACAVREVTLLEDSIALGNFTSDRTQSGCARFSYLPLTSKVPRRYQCQPDTAIALEVQKQQESGTVLTQPQLDAISGQIQSRLQPSFSALAYGNPAFGQLDSKCPIEIRTGASDGSEMGVFHDLHQVRRQKNALARIAEYLRLGLEAGIFYRT